MQVTGVRHEVHDGESIQAAVKAAKAGDVIAVYPGTYHETVYIDKSSITMTGVVREGRYPTLDGEKKLNDAFLYSGDNITIENFKIINYKGNGVMGQAGNNFVIRNNLIHDAGVYGIFPEFGKNGLVEHNVLSGIEDAAIYIGMSDNVDVRHNKVYDNVAGIEIENSRHALVEGNYAYNNTGGILVFITPGLPIKTTYDVIVRDNFVLDNNHENFGAPGSIVSGIPAGTGILVMAADDVVIENNIIAGNDNAGLIVTDISSVTNVASDPESEPNPDRVRILENVMFNNGNNPIGELKALMLTQLETKGPDIVDTGAGSDKCVMNGARYRAYGLGSYRPCRADEISTATIASMTLSAPAEPFVIAADTQDGYERIVGERAYYGVCTGCHAYGVRLIGPPVTEIQAIYEDNPEALAAYIADPVKVRENFPEMPPQDYLSEETRLAVAKYILSTTNTDGR
ncbi:MAG: cytochrome-c peroxidase [Alphaproteobacteria bacterium]|nr:MAG: cytochrome-c peroxidase [Alphaproteobacteria bacterium]